MRMRFIVPILLAMVCPLPNPVRAWHRNGHFTIARIAWKHLNEKQQLEITRILRAHPHFEVYLKDRRPKDLLTEAEWAFVQSSTWADWVRDPMGPGIDGGLRKSIKKQFNKPFWHYVDLPYIHPNDVARFDAAAIRKTILEPAYDAKGEPRHALAALERAMKNLRSQDTSDAEKAVALCWLVHVVGDLHQPLHGTSLIASKETYDPPLDPPGGDLGGNRVVVLAKAGGAKAVNLHFYWDALLFDDESGFADVEGLAAKLQSDPKLRRDQLPELKTTGFLAWAEESLALAKSTVYKGKDGFLAVRTLPMRGKPSLVGLDAPVLPAGYREAAERVAARRMVLAGYRLAAQLQLALKGER